MSDPENNDLIGEGLANKKSKPQHDKKLGKKSWVIFFVTLFRLTIDAEMINFEDEVRSKYQQSEDFNEDSVIEEATNMKQNQVL